MIRAQHFSPPGLAALPLLLAGLLLGSSCGEHAEPRRERWPAPTDAPPPHAYRSHIELPYDRLGMNTALRDMQGRPVRVRCATCHQARSSEPETALRATPPRAFHVGVALEHGEQMTCRTCHRPPLYQTYRLSSGKTVAYAAVIELCGQCHSGQRRDYAHGVHGGMTGYWDLDRGPRSRNHCLDCHNPHRPQIPSVMPAPRPRHRFVEE